MYITGGSSGLGLSFAHILAKKGASISIVARNQKKLDEALASLEVSFALYDVSLIPMAYEDLGRPCASRQRRSSQRIHMRWRRRLKPSLRSTRCVNRMAAMRPTRCSHVRGAQSRSSSWKWMSRSWQTACRAHTGCRRGPRGCASCRTLVVRG